MPEKTRFFSPTRSYDFEMKIKDLDFSNDLTSVKILSSLSTAYQIVLLELLVDPSDLILNDIFGSDPINLHVHLLAQEAFPSGLEEVDLELMYLNSEFKLIEEVSSPTGFQKDRSPVTIATVCRQPFKTMNTLVNEVYAGTTIRQILTDLASQVQATIEYDSDHENTETLDQVCIPPTTFYKIIKENDPGSDDPFDGYLDKNFGLFGGVPGVFCQHDNKVYIKNLTAKMKKNQTFTVHQLVSNSDNKEIIESSTDGKTFYTYNLINTDYSGNAKFAVLAPTLRYIGNPRDRLYNIIEQDLEDVCSTYGLICQNKTIPIDPNISKTSRISYDNSGTGYERSEILYDSKVSRAVADLSTISMDLEWNLPVLNLMNVGEPVKFSTKIVPYIDLTGQYILWSSELNFTKSGGWESVARINLVRTNKKI